ncbi:MAG: MFS transporter [Chloroflexi bacterium]|nr:MFS transporter [Chloroflexota bacterium]MCI0575486.1 MFS transporter [Chloroflexota bacterium]MCI0646668.1 MFS transporter [Chloroflexota bacterium]MCI0726397.1 MFS transporter [Chloroflexota bacterium]
MLPAPLHLALRRLLQVDRPVLQRTDDEVTAEMYQNYRWNFAVNLLDGASFWFGSSFISSTTIVPLFVSKLTDNPFFFGLAAVIAQGSWFLPQLLTANVVERLARKKPVVVNLGLFLERMPLWLIVLAAVVATRSPGLALALFLIAYAWHGLGAGVIATAWQDLLARCFPVERRGRFFGTTMFVGAGAGTAAAGFSASLLKNYPFPTNFVYTFIVAALGISLSWFFIALTREPVRPVTLPRQNQRQFWGDLRRIVRADHNFRHFLVARLLLALAGMGSGFITVAAVQRWQVPDAMVGYYTAAGLLGQTAANLAFGFLADKRGHKLSLEISSLALLLAFVIAWLAPAPEWYYLVFGLQGITLSAIIVSGILVVMEFSPPDKRPTYTGLVNTGVGLVSSVAPLLGAGLATLNYDWLFALSALVSLLALVAMRWWVREPRFV